MAFTSALMFQCGKVASGNLYNFVQKFIAMFVLTCWNFFPLENTPSGILCKSYGFYNRIHIEISAWSGCHAACSSHVGVVCIACCSYGSYFCTCFFNQLCISLKTKPNQTTTPKNKNNKKAAFGFENKFRLSSNWMFVSGTAICKVFAFFHCGIYG